MTPGGFGSLRRTHTCIQIATSIRRRKLTCSGALEHTVSMVARTAGSDSCSCIDNQNRPGGA